MKVKRKLKKNLNNKINIYLIFNSKQQYNLITNLN